MPDVDPRDRILVEALEQVQVTTEEPILEREEDVEEEEEEEEEETATCSDCGGDFNPDALNGDDRCESCQESYTFCERCEETVHCDNTQTVHVNSSRRRTATWCESCVDDYAFTCDDCQNTYSDGSDRWRTESGTTVCQSCYEDSYTCCADCSDAILTENAFERGDNYYCSACDPGEDDEDREEQRSAPAGVLSPNGIADYSFKPQPVFFGNRKSVMYGVELEVNADESVYGANTTSAMQTLKLLGRDHVYCKGDSSIGYGYEIVTHPHTLDEHRKLWPAFFNDVPEKTTSFKSGKCGMHVHIERAKLTRLQIGKMLVFLNAPQNEKFIEKIAQRTSNHYSEIIEKKLTDRDYQREGNRYEALNVTNRHTVELRIFRGTVRADRFWKNLEFTDAVVQWTRDVSYQDLSAARFVEYVLANQREYKYLYQYLIEIGYIDPLEIVRKEILAACA